MREIKRFYEFKEFRIDLSNKVLTRLNGEIVPLTPKVFETLLLLVQNQGRLLEKSEMMQTIWADTFVEENNLTFNIKMIRRALGDEAANPTFIETVPRRGYRFVPEVKEIIEEKNTPPIFVSANETVFPKAQTPLFQSRYALFAVLTIVFVSSLGFGSWLWQRHVISQNAPILSNDFDAVRISDTGKVVHSVISPDGKTLAYINQVGGKQGIWLRNLENSLNTSVVAPSEDFYYGLDFSSDGQTLFFTRRPKDVSTPMNLMSISVKGENLQKITERCQGWISVSPDGKKISFVRYDEGVSEFNKLMVIDVDGKNEREVKVSEKNKVFWANAFSPDGRKIAAAYGNSTNSSQEIALVEVDVETGALRELAPKRFFHIKDVEWLPDQSGLLFTADERLGETIRIWKLDYQSRLIESLTKDSVNYGKISLNNNADILAASAITSDFHLFVQSGENPKGFKDLTQARDSFAFTPDGKIIYATDTAGNEDIWKMNLDGTEQSQLTVDRSLDAEPLVTNDNRYIFFSSNRSGKNQIWRMDIDGANQMQITQKKGGYAVFYSLTENKLYYRASEDNSVRSVLFNGGSEEEVIAKAGIYQTISPDEKHLAYIWRDADKKVKLTVVELKTKTAVRSYPIAEGTPFVVHWNDAQNLVYVTEKNGETHLIWRQSVAKDTPELLHDLGEKEVVDFKYAPDGKTAAFIQGSWNHDAYLLKGLK
ncbi:MAG TPA: winged helix-turn-helix domain-containing protein [Pyrinomonadaceae bacterium]|nr:winged helix-turn-helix domain-containing protein [Pyrinomonadaceae bacterium]